MVIPATSPFSLTRDMLFAFADEPEWFVSLVEFEVRWYDGDGTRLSVRTSVWRDGDGEVCASTRGSCRSTAFLSAGTSAEKKSEDHAGW